MTSSCVYYHFCTAPCFLLFPGLKRGLVAALECFREPERKMHWLLTKPLNSGWRETQILINSHGMAILHMEMAPIRPPHDKFLKKTKRKSFNGVGEVRNATGGGGDCNHVISSLFNHAASLNFRSLIAGFKRHKRGPSD